MKLEHFWLLAIMKKLRISQWLILLLDWEMDMRKAARPITSQSTFPKLVCNSKIMRNDFDAFIYKTIIEKP